MSDPTATFMQFRPDMTGIAYRMTGSLAVAEDMVQDAFLRWHTADQPAIDNPRAWLLKVVTRLCLDWLRAAPQRRGQYVGPWLPEPLLHTQDAPQALKHMHDEDLSVAFLVTLQQLSPAERAVFILHDLFETPFDEIATLLARSPAACRQLASRARRHLTHRNRPGPAPDSTWAMRVAEAFLEASRSGDEAALRTILAEDVRLISDGGGIRPAALNVIEGVDRICRLLVAQSRRNGRQAPPVLYRDLINGAPGFVTVETDGLIQTTTLTIAGERITAIQIVRNPEKLAGIEGRLVH
ncbi:sigma-70 family RNA polymerase sigma factor [Gluconacetobacter azotocaptans]|uniref:Sigma-70 family RNA polymerase sigma factor n=1 Tax=Gluconacetobacter azotocaptans TaxID=142834 RepID=A0A7W4JRC4_9PROT|nr:sigma-70 family RNA polymerase sigma factor [Gluconacetobacter azotocaptans]MBB2189505.1 sigma-70 family RNA polymerase sigma factor [Gluconacetobacter azotocaptans]